MTPLTTLTTEPLNTPPSLHCPECDGLLRYVRSYMSGTRREQEQWDVFGCTITCGTFEYRHRTRRLRRMTADEVSAVRVRNS